jgi:hypothetical protein
MNWKKTDFFSLLQARAYYPESFSKTSFNQRYVYGSVDVWEGRFEKLIAKNFLEKRGESNYVLTSRGLEVDTQFFEQYRKVLIEKEPQITDIDFTEII